MGDHVFISYDREDLDYVTGLAEALSERGIDHWSDKQIDPATKWVSVIRERLDSSAGVVVVMSPAAEDSEWVDKEIHRAESKKRPIFPLLLHGEPLFILGGIQYEDVTQGGLPSEEWFSAICRLVGAGTGDAALDPQQREDETRQLAEEQARLVEAHRPDDVQTREAEAERQLAEEEAAAKRLAEQEAEEEAAAKRLAEQEAEEEERRRRRMRAILIGAAAVVVVAVVGIVIALSGGGGDGGGDGPETAEVTVAGDQVWTETDIDCGAGDSLAITAEGTVFHNEETSTGPDGDSGVPPEFNVVSDAPHAALIGRIGDDGAPFQVGSSVAGTCPAAGPLFLGVNDAGPENNSGEFIATVELQPAG